ncbi:MAG: YdcH family protein, partial [Stellaceae bacterium]
LRARHKSLEEAITTETHRPFPNVALVADWKRQKLRIKDEIVEMERTP